MGPRGSPPRPPPNPPARAPAALDFTFVCPTEIVNFSEAAAAFKAINCDVVGVSVDRCVCAACVQGPASALSFFARDDTITHT